MNLRDEYINHLDAEYAKATRLNGDSCIFCVREGGSYAWERTAIFDHEKVWFCHELRMSCGNANPLRSPDVELCGYSIPHPSEAVMNLRIQTYGMCPSRFL